MNTVYFQPPNIDKKYCEVGMISETDPEYIWYLDEPCKVLISEVKIIDKENVRYNKKSRTCHVIQRSEEVTHCESYEFRRQGVRCVRQCSSCEWMDKKI